MRMGIRNKLFISFLVIVIYCIYFAWINDQSSSKVQKSILNVLTSVTPAIQNLENMRTNAMSLLESSASVQLMLALGQKYDSVVLAEEIEEGQIAKQNLSDALVLYKSEFKKNSAENPDNKIERLIESIITDTDSLLKLDSKKMSGELIKLKEKLEESEEEFLRETYGLIQSEMADIEYNTEVALATARNSREYFRYSAITIIVIALINALILSHFLTRPIKALNSAAKKVSDGDFTYRIPNKSNDEISELTDSFNLMSEKLSQTMVSTKFLGNTVNSLQDYLLVVSEDLKIEFANNTFTKSTGLDPENVLGQSIFEFLTISKESRIKIRENGLTEQETEALLAHADGEICPVMFLILQINGIESEQSKKIVIIRDQREKIRNENEIYNFRNRASQAEKLASLCTLGGIVAHKLNQPLTAIKLFLQQSANEVSRHSLPEIVLSNLKDSLEATEQASSIVQEVLQFSKQKTSMPKTKINIQSIIQQTINALRFSVSKAGLKISQSGLDLLPEIDAYKLEIEEVFYILIQNAVAASESVKKSELKISGNFNDGHINITLEDTCGGMPVENIDKLFDQIVSTKEQGQGSGFGLHIARQIVKNHGGSLQVKSKADVGTTISLSFPAGISLSDSTVSSINFNEAGV